MRVRVRVRVRVRLGFELWSGLGLGLGLGLRVGLAAQRRSRTGVQLETARHRRAAPNRTALVTHLAVVAAEVAATARRWLVVHLRRGLGLGLGLG